MIRRSAGRPGLRLGGFRLVVLGICYNILLSLVGEKCPGRGSDPDARANGHAVANRARLPITSPGLTHAHARWMPERGGYQPTHPFRLLLGRPARPMTYMPKRDE